jgi:FemAB-related protein (PEP-CTERM system-associated)
MMQQTENQVDHGCLFMPRLAAHDPAWLTTIERGLKQQVFRLSETENGREVACLPLALVRGPIFGKFLVSLPYINTGGVYSENRDAAMRLVDRACDLADQHQVRYLELRHEQPLDHPRLNARREDKVHMRLSLPGSFEQLLRSFKSKLRSQIKKAGENPFECEFGGQELLQEFYGVFAINMRDLGTPVFPRQLFAEVLRNFDQRAEVCVVRLHGSPVAGALLIHNELVTEVPSASSLRTYNSTGANMWMYSRLLERAIERGARTFDFGRSSVDSGTYKFKQQWGALPQQAVWQYYLRSGSQHEMRADDPSKQRMVEIWKRLPVWLTKWIGPPIIRGIP